MLDMIVVGADNLSVYVGGPVTMWGLFMFKSKLLILSACLLASASAIAGTSRQPLTETPIPPPAPPQILSPVPMPEPLPAPAPITGGIEFNANDVSILFPAPERPEDIITHSLRLTDFDTDKVFPELEFQQSMAVITGPSTLTLPDRAFTVDAGAIPGSSSRIRFPGINSRQDWALAGIRIDPGAPGLTTDIFDVFGKSPQIRLILQPIRTFGSNVQVTDGSLHLVYAFHAANDPTQSCRFHNVPDMEGFHDAVADLKAIKDRFARDHGVDTTGRPLGIHPAFATAGPEFKAVLRDYLNEYLTLDRLFAVSVAGIPLPAPEPWVFVAMQRSPFSGNIEAVPGLAIEQPEGGLNLAQMISFIDQRQIQPAPATRNKQPVDCRSNLSSAIREQNPDHGVSTAMVFDRSFQSVSNPPGISAVSEIIADPARSHFFNTDCVSCHTETRKEIDQGAATVSQIARESHIDPAVIPDGQWNVRAFGWFPGFPQRRAGAHETVTRRTALETEEVVECFKTDRWSSADQSCLP